MTEIIDRKKARRVIAWGIYMLAALLVQNMLISRIPILGVRAMFLPAVCVAAAMLEGGTGGAVFGLVMGLFADMAFPENTVLFTVLFPVIGFFAGFAADFFLNRKFWPYMLMSLAAMLLTALAQMVLPLLSSGSAATLFKTAALQTLWGLPLAAAFYPWARSIAGKHGGVAGRNEIS